MKLLNEISVKNLDHLGWVATSIMDEIVSLQHVVTARIFNGLGFVSAPLYNMFGNFLNKKRQKPRFILDLVFNENNATFLYVISSKIQKQSL